jgi:hypothetical protein
MQCALAFFAFLHIGEITATSQPGNCPIQLNQLTKLSRDGEVIGCKLTFADYKHNYNQRPFTMVTNKRLPCAVIINLFKPSWLWSRSGIYDSGGCRSAQITINRETTLSGSIML